MHNIRNWLANFLLFEIMTTTLRSSASHLSIESFGSFDSQHETAVEHVAETLDEGLYSTGVKPLGGTGRGSRNHSILNNLEQKLSKHKIRFSSMQLNALRNNMYQVDGIHYFPTALWNKFVKEFKDILSQAGVAFKSYEFKNLKNYIVNIIMYKKLKNKHKKEKRKNNIKNKKVVKHTKKIASSHLVTDSGKSVASDSVVFKSVGPSTTGAGERLMALEKRSDVAAITLDKFMLYKGFALDRKQATIFIQKINSVMLCVNSQRYSGDAKPKPKMNTFCFYYDDACFVKDSGKRATFHTKARKSLHFCSYLRILAKHKTDTRIKNPEALDCLRDLNMADFTFDKISSFVTEDSVPFYSFDFLILVLREIDTFGFYTFMGVKFGGISFLCFYCSLLDYLLSGLCYTPNFIGTFDHNGCNCPFDGINQVSLGYLDRLMEEFEQYYSARSVDRVLTLFKEWKVMRVVAATSGGGGGGGADSGIEENPDIVAMSNFLWEDYEDQMDILYDEDYDF